MMLAFSGLIGLGALAGLITAWLSHRHYEQAANRIRNPGFEEGVAWWGSGYMEDGVRTRNWPGEIEILPYVISPNPRETKSSGQHDPSVGHDSKSSYKFIHQTGRKEKHFGSLSQRVTGLRKNKSYVVSFWLKAAADDIEPGTFFVTTDYPWADAQPMLLTKEWKQHVHRFNAGELDYADIRFVIQAPGTVWLDNVDVREDFN
jgi:hypothetical protein